MSHKPSLVPVVLAKLTQRPPGVPVKAALAGQLLANRKIVDNKTKQVKQETSTTQALTGENGAMGYVGLNLGLNIPGPEKSFLMARVDIICILPTRSDTDDEVRATMRRVDALVDEELQTQVEEAKQALGLE